MKPWMSDMYNSGLASGQLCTAVCRSMTSSVFLPSHLAGLHCYRLIKQAYQHGPLL